jgi:hypothetical protein
MKAHRVRLSVSPVPARRPSAHGRDVEACAASIPEPCKAKHRGNHHLLVKLQLWLPAHVSRLIFALLLSSLGLAGLTWLHTPQHPAAPAAAASPSSSSQHKLLLATHNRLAWWSPLNASLTVLHGGQVCTAHRRRCCCSSGLHLQLRRLFNTAGACTTTQGVHYGLFPGDPLPSHPHTVWNLIRPHNWRPTAAMEHLVQLDADSGAELARVEVPSRFGHDVVRAACGGQHALHLASSQLCPCACAPADPCGRPCLHLQHR